MRPTVTRQAADVRPLELVSPGFRGLNTELTSVAGDIDGQWALALQEAVFDEQGTISSRKGWQNITTSAMSGTPDVVREFEYIQDDGTKMLIAQTDAKLWQSADGVAWTDVTGSLTWTTGQVWQFVNFNGVCVGVVVGQHPAVYTGSGNFATITAASGSTPVSDGTVLAAYGRVWFGENATGAVVYSALLDYTLYAESNGGGALDTSNVWTGGTDERIGIYASGATFVIFGRKHIIMYVDGSGSTEGIDPNNMYVVDTIEGTGLIARDAVVHIGTGDLWFASEIGMQSIKRVLQDKSNPLAAVSQWVTSLFTSLLANEGNPRYTVQATYNAKERIVLVLFPGSTRILMFDTRFPMEDGTARCSEWRNQTHTCVMTRGDYTTHFGRTGGKIAAYTGYYDGTVGTYITLLVASPHLTCGQRALLKMPKRVTWRVLGRETLSIVTRWGFDQRGLEFSNTQTNDYVSSGSEFGLAEFGEDDWSTGIRTRNGYTPLSGNGITVQLYMTITNVDVAARVSLKDLILYHRFGRAG